MARLNIEDSIFKDNRFLELCMKTQSIDTALGSLVRAWSLAQKWYLKDDRMIPLSEWKKQKINDLVIEVGLAEIIGNKVKVDGSDDQFQWLIQKQEAGKKGGKSKSSNRNKEDMGLASAKRVLTGESGPKPLTPSLTPSLSLSTNSNSSSNSDYYVGDEKKSTHLSKAQARGSIPEFEHNDICLELLKNVTHKSQQAWIAAYPNVQWIGHEMLKANAWIVSNPRKAPTNFGKFFTSWLSRAFEDHRKNIPSNHKTYGQKVQANNEAIRRQLDEEEARAEKVSS